MRHKNTGIVTKLQPSATVSRYKNDPNWSTTTRSTVQYTGTTRQLVKLRMLRVGAADE
uniref:Uncharacterized protein n=1 Tax=Mycolicibacterium sp. CBMA 213 TaxID=1968788 RepID=A0A343VR33_9MYCO|nr:hypothetical protein B5P44_p00062 [Mycolicibacterium sp. CBMA 213]